MKTIARFARWYCILLLIGWIGPKIFFTTIAPDEIGVRQSNFSGVHEEDLGPGWALRVPGIHRVYRLPRRYEYLDYTEDDVGPQDSLQIRTQDNNIVRVDVSVPYHVKPGSGFEVVKAGNHLEDRDELLRFQRLAEETTVSVLRETLALLTSADWYNTKKRLEVAEVALEALNESLSDLEVEAEAVLIRSVSFRPAYERQLQQIQLNEQNKLLDGARQTVAGKQQKLDNYQQGTNALAAARAQEWATRLAQLEGAYTVGLIDTGSEVGVGAARAQLDGLEDAARAELTAKAAEALGIEEDSITDSYLLGIKNVQAETLEYDQRTRLAADAVSARLVAEGNAEIATVRGAYEAELNKLLDSAAGRAWVAFESAEHVSFDTTLEFASGDGLPSVLRLRQLTEEFMGLR